MSLAHALRNLDHDDIDIVYSSLPFIKTLSPSRGNHSTPLKDRRVALAEAFMLARDSFSLTHETLRRKNKQDQQQLAPGSRSSKGSPEAAVPVSSYNTGDPGQNERRRSIQQQHQKSQQQQQQLPRHQRLPTEDQSLYYSDYEDDHGLDEDRRDGQLIDRRETQNRNQLRMQQQLQQQQQPLLDSNRDTRIESDEYESAAQEPVNIKPSRQQQPQMLPVRHQPSPQSQPQSHNDIPDTPPRTDSLTTRIKGSKYPLGKPVRKSVSTPDLGSLVDRARGRAAATATAAAIAGEASGKIPGTQQSSLFSQNNSVFVPGPVHSLPAVLPLSGTDDYISPSITSRQFKDRQTASSRNKPIEFLRPGDGLFSSSSDSLTSSEFGNRRGYATHALHRAQYTRRSRSQEPQNRWKRPSAGRPYLSPEDLNRQLPPTPTTSPPKQSHQVAPRTKDFARTIFTVPPIVTPYDPIKDYLPQWLRQTYNYWRWTLNLSAHNIPQRYAVWVSLHLHHSTIWYHVQGVSILADEGKFRTSDDVNKYILRKATGHIKVQEEIARFEFNQLYQPDGLPVIVFNSNFLRIFNKIRHFYHPDRLAIQYYDRLSPKIRRRLNINFYEKYTLPTAASLAYGADELNIRSIRGATADTHAYWAAPAKPFISIENLMAAAELADDTYRPLPATAPSKSSTILGSLLLGRGKDGKTIRERKEKKDKRAHERNFSSIV